MTPSRRSPMTLTSLGLGLLLAVLALYLAACSAERVGRTFGIDDADSAFAQIVIADWRQGDIGSVLTALDPELTSQVPDLWSILHLGHMQFPSGEPASTRLVGFYRHVSALHGSNTLLTYEYDYGSSLVLASIGFTKKGDGPYAVYHLQMFPDAQAMKQHFAFSLKDKSLVHYIILALAVCLPIVCVGAFVVCLRTPILRRKWLWALGTLVGIGGVQLDWSSGIAYFHPLSFYLFGAAARGIEYTPWMITVSMPVGAILFFVRRQHLKERAELAHYAATAQDPPVA